MLGELLETVLQDTWVYIFRDTSKTLRKSHNWQKQPEDKYSSGHSQKVQSRTHGTSHHQTYSEHYARVPQSDPASTDWLCCPSPRLPLLNPTPRLSTTLCSYSPRHCNKRNQGVHARQQLNLPTRSIPFPKPVCYLSAEWQKGLNEQ